MAQLNLKQATSAENYSTTLTNAIAAGDTTITLNSTTNLNAPGIYVIDRVDANGTVKSTSSWEYVYFTGISTNDTTGCVRGQGGSTAQAHSAGAVVESVMTASYWQGIYTVLNTSLTDDGTGLHVSNATISSALKVNTLLSASGASVQGIGARDNFTWGISGSLVTSTNGSAVPLHIVPGLTKARFASAVLMTAPSGASVVIDIKNKDASIFTAATRLAIAGGGTFVSTASIGTTALTPGMVLKMTVDAIGTDATFSGGQLTVLLGTEP